MEQGYNRGKYGASVIEGKWGKELIEKVWSKCKCRDGASDLKRKAETSVRVEMEQRINKFWSECKSIDGARDE